MNYKAIKITCPRCGEMFPYPDKNSICIRLHIDCIKCLNPSDIQMKRIEIELEKEKSYEDKKRKTMENRK